MSISSTLSEIKQGDNRVRTRDFSDCSRMPYNWSISLSHGFNTMTANVCSWRQLSIMFVLRSQTSFCDCASHLYQCVQNDIRGHPDSNQGALRLQLNALPLSFIPSSNRFFDITAKTRWWFEHCYHVFCSELSVLSRPMPFFSSLSKIIQGTTRFEPGTFRTAAECSTTEIYPRCIQRQ